LTFFGAISTHAQVISEPVTKVTSGAILQTTKGSLLVLYGIEAPKRGSPAAQIAKDFTAAQVIGKDTVIEVYAQKFGLTYVKVLLADKQDLSKLLLNKGLATWDRGAWPELVDFDTLEKAGKLAFETEQSNALMKREAERVANNERLQKEDEARQLERQKKEWERSVKEWIGFSPEQRESIRTALEARRKALEPKVTRARALYNVIASADKVLDSLSEAKSRADRAYAEYESIFGPELSAEIEKREVEDFMANNETALAALVTEFDRLNAEINVEYTAYASESQRVAALDSTLSPDVMEAEKTGQRSSIARAAEVNSDATGTGFLIAKDLIMTCAHVVENAKTINVRTRRDKVIPATVVAKDDNSDWCILRVKGIIAHHIPLAQKTPEVGSTVFTLGYPLGKLMENKDPIAGSGNVAALQGIGGDKRHIQVTVPLNNGASGSPILNLNGEWVALASHKVNDIVALNMTGAVPQGLNFAVRADFIEPNATIRLDTKFARGGSETELTLQETVRRYSESVVLVLVERG